MYGDENTENDVMQLHNCLTKRVEFVRMLQ